MPDQNERIAVMNPDAVEEAKVYTGDIHYYDRVREIHHQVSGQPFVEVGKWTAEGEEASPRDFLCTYYAAVLLGYDLKMDWLPAGESGDRKFIIYSGVDENGGLIPLLPEEAPLVALKINAVLEAARHVRS